MDFAGQTIPVRDPAIGKSYEAQILVAVLGASSYTYVRACRAQDLEC